MKEILTQAFKCLETIHKRKKLYHEALKPFNALRGDFRLEIFPLDDEVENVVVKLLDMILGENEWASHWLYEASRMNNPMVIAKGRGYSIKNIKGLKNYIMAEVIGGME